MKMFEFSSAVLFLPKIANLALLCKEKWSIGETDDYSILKNYVFYTFEKVYAEGKVIEKETYAIFNTGLFDKYQEEIFGLFFLNPRPNKQKWLLDSFYNKYDIGKYKLTSLEFPTRANYFENPTSLIFDTNCEIIAQYHHIFDDPENLRRIPEPVRSDPLKKLKFDGAISLAKKLIDANYKTAVPQFYKGKIQLLIPIYLLGNDKPDLALVVTKGAEGNIYYGHTCLSLDMAYTNARLIARPNSEWLQA